jgi:shikimate kinase
LGLSYFAIYNLQLTIQKVLIYLIGFMGCGKTTIGRLLAQRLNYTFVDTDALVEQQAQQSISTIFEQYGETYFRTLEQAVLQTTTTCTYTIVSTGGGMPCFENNISLIQQAGNTIYLKASPDVLAKRLWLEKDMRPLLKNLGDENALSTFIAQKLLEREPFYLKAKHILETDNLLPNEIVGEIINYKL